MHSSHKSSIHNKSGCTCSKLNLKKIWDLENYEIHKYNLKTAKSNIDNGAPKPYPHLNFNPKKIQLDLVKLCEVQRDNKSLLNRLSTIHKKGGWIDAKNEYKTKSLNALKRHHDMIQLSHDNQAFNKRLINTQPAVFNRNKLEDQYLTNRKYGASIAKFPDLDQRTIEQMKEIRKKIKKKVISTRTGRRNSDTDRENRRRARQKIAFEAEKAKKAASVASEVKEKELKSQEENRKKQLQWKQDVEKFKTDSTRWREAKEERIRLAKECQEKEMEQEKNAKLIEEKRQRQLNSKKKLEIIKWKLKKQEEETKKEECGKEKKRKNMENKARVQVDNKALNNYKGKPVPTSNENNGSILVDDGASVGERKGGVQQLDLNMTPGDDMVLRLKDDQQSGAKTGIGRRNQTNEEVNLEDMAPGEDMDKPFKDDQQVKEKSGTKREIGGSKKKNKDLDLEDMTPGEDMGKLLKDDQQVKKNTEIETEIGRSNQTDEEVNLEDMTPGEDMDESLKEDQQVKEKSVIQTEIGRSKQTDEGRSKGVDSEEDILEKKKDNISEINEKTNNSVDRCVTQ